MNTMQQFNWVDIFVVILLVRIGYVAIKSGFVAELFKLLGTILAIYLSLHYFIILSAHIGHLKATKSIPLEFLAFLYFIILAVLGYLIFVFFRRIFSWSFKMEAAPSLNKWGGFILGIIRMPLLVSLIIFILSLSPLDYFKNSINNSNSGKFFFEIAPNTYSWLWNSIMSKFMVDEKFNESVFKIQTSPTRK